MQWQLPDGRDTLWVALYSDPVTVDVSLAADSTSHAILNQLMEAPFRYSSSGGIEPAGAESYEVSENGLVYTINLRQGTGWSDGEPVLAQQYVDGIIRLLDPETRAEYAYIMFYISGAEEFNSGSTTDPSTVGVRALDDYTLELTLSEPQSFFDSILAFSTMYPVRLDLIEQYGDSWTEPGNLVGNGPYVLTQWAHDSHLSVELNPHYHGASAITIQQVMFPIIDSAASSLAAFERGELDVSSFPISELPRILEEMPESFVRLPRPGVLYCAFNTQLHPSDNLNLRLALSSAVDRRAILDDVMRQPWRTEACGVIPPEIPGHQGCGAVGYAYDPNGALGYLEAARAEMGIDNASDIVVELWSTGGSVMQAVEVQWENNLGITVNMIDLEWEDFLEARDLCND
jgi:oligopeptide transport system substrate-binding protein